MITKKREIRGTIQQSYALDMEIGRDREERIRCLKKPRMYAGAKMIEHRTGEKRRPPWEEEH